MNIIVGILKYPPDYAGDGLRLHRTFQRLQKKGALDQVHVLTSWDQAASQQAENLDGISITRPVECTLKSRFGSFFKRLPLPWQMGKLISCFSKLAPEADLVLTSGSGWFPSLIAWLAFFHRKPVVKEIVLLGSDDPLTLQRTKPFWCRWFFLAPFRFAHLIIAISPALETTCLDFGIPQKKIWFRFNPVDFEIFPEEKPQKRIGEEIPVILWIGAVTPRKNVRFLLESACYLTAPAKIWFVGPYDNEDYLLELVEIQKKVPSYVEVKFFGHVKDRKKLIQLYSQARLFWFASQSEGMGNVVAESLVCGTPVLTLPVMGIMRQVIPSTEDGEVVDTHDPKEFAHRASHWLTKKVDRAAISERARKRFNAEKIDDQYRARFEKIAHKSTLPIKTDLQEQPVLVSGTI